MAAGAGKTSRHRILGAVLLVSALAFLLAADPNPTATDQGTDVPPPSGWSSAATRDCALPQSVDADLLRSERVLLGLSAFNCEQPARSVEFLDIEANPSTDLEDWRLYALAAAAHQGEQLDLAKAAADALLIDHANSPLADSIRLLRTQIALDAGEPSRALAMARESRDRTISDELRTQLDVLAWTAANELESDSDIEQEARQLLLASPIRAIELDAAAALADADGSLAWPDHFTSPELLLRASRLMAADLLDDALQTLEAVPTADRDLDWHLTRAAALVEDRRGVEALELLETAAAPDALSGLELQWLRSQAAFDAATARKGRQNLPSAERAAMRDTAQGYLRQIIRHGGDSARALEAHRRLFEELADGEHFDEVKEILQRLVAIDPSDSSGERYLWRLGWDQYSKRNYSGAVGYWSELQGLYPSRKLARSAHYWSARSHEALGDSRRARQLYGEIANTPATDYYRKHALIRLGSEPGVDSETAPIVTLAWPTDPALDRAERLSDLGIDALGMLELDALDERAQPRAVTALRSRILARQGHRRDSIQNVWRVFPMLGTSGQVAVPEDALQMYYPLDFIDIVQRFADTNRLPVPLLLAMIRQESAFDIRARSFAGARGLMQVMPATAQELAQRMGLPYSRERLLEPTYSVQLGSRYFRQVLDMFDGDLELALAGYNAGPYRIRKLVRSAGPDLEPDHFLEGLKIEESKTYVKRIVLFLDSYQRLYPSIG